MASWMFDLIISRIIRLYLAKSFANNSITLNRIVRERLKLDLILHRRTSTWSNRSWTIESFKFESFTNDSNILHGIIRKWFNFVQWYRSRTIRLSDLSVHITFFWKNYLPNFNIFSKFEATYLSIEIWI